MDAPVLTVVIPGRVPSANALWRLDRWRRHHAVKDLRARVQQIAQVQWMMQGRAEIRPPALVHFLMRRRRRFDVGDDLNFAIKPYRDEIVHALGLKNDGPVLGNRFAYDQECSKTGPEELVITVTLLPVKAVGRRRAAGAS